MDTIVYILRLGIEKLLTPFDWLGPFWGLTLLSLLSGVFMLWVVGKTTPQALVERSRNRMDSAIYEIRLFLDSPKRVFISLGRLISHSLLYVAFMLPAFVILALPLTFMYLGLETRHGMEPIAANQPFVISVDLADGVDGSNITYTTSDGLEITAPLLYVPSQQAVYLRGNLKTPTTEYLGLTVDGLRVDKEIVGDSSAVQMAPDRASGIDLFISYGPEEVLGGKVTGIRVPHEMTDNEYLGIQRWCWWWLLLMMIAAFGLKKRLGVAL
jgi:hypothetical protein